MNNEQRSQWRSFPSYVLVTTGAIVGLSNIFRFPFLLTKYGGLFLLFYIICQLSVALPLLFAELLIGRRGKQNPVGSIGILTMEAQASPRWRLLGWLCFLIAFITMCYYIITAAFPVGYFIDNIKDIFTHATPIGEAVKLDTNSVSTFSQLETWFIIFLLLAMLVLYRGINRGLEQISMITVPLYFIILLALAIYISTQGYFGETIRHLFQSHPDVSIYEVFIAALALSFLKYNVGMGVMIVYGSYLPYQVSLAKSTILIVLIDAIVSLLSYFIVFPLALASSANGMLPDLSTNNVITIFGSIHHSLILSALFFFSAILIAWTPIIAMGETVIVTLMERLNWSRVKACYVLAFVLLIIGTVIVGSNMKGMSDILFGHITFYNMLRNFTMNVMAPVAAFFIAIFAGWIIKKNVTENELNFKHGFYVLWRFLIRYIAPAAIILIFIALML